MYASWTGFGRLADRAAAVGVLALVGAGCSDDNSTQPTPPKIDIAFYTDRDGNFEIYRMTDDGKKLVNLTNDPAGDFTPAWQPYAKHRR